MFNLFKTRDDRQAQRDFYDETQRNARARRRDLDQPVNKNPKTKASPEWYKWASIAATAGIIIVAILFSQMVMMTIYNLNADVRKGLAPAKTIFSGSGIAPFYLIFIGLSPLIWWYLRHKMRALWMSNNAMYLSDDIEKYANDAYVQTLDHITTSFDIAPDAGLGFDGHVSSIVGHAMIDNAGIKKIEMPVFDPDVEGQVKRDADGNVVTELVPMFDKAFGSDLYKFSNVSVDFREWIKAKEYDFNPSTSKKEQKAGIMRQGSFGRKPYDTLADFINEEFYPLDTDTQRPAGVYFYDSRPVNTVLIAITRVILPHSFSDERHAIVLIALNS